MSYEVVEKKYSNDLVSIHLTDRDWFVVTTEVDANMAGARFFQTFVLAMNYADALTHHLKGHELTADQASTYAGETIDEVNLEQA